MLDACAMFYVCLFRLHVRYNCACLLLSYWFTSPMHSLLPSGSILAAKAKSDEHLKEAKKEAKRIIHAFHKARDMKVSLEVSVSTAHVLCEASSYDWITA